jgi:uncharacterized protein
MASTKHVTGAIELSEADARALMLAAQGLHRRPDRATTKVDVLRAIRRMGALQIDTIHVVARSPYLVLWSRLGDYEPRWLDELLAEGALFEYWSHAACWLPIEDYPLYRRRMQTYATTWGWSGARAWIGEHRGEMERMLALVRERGPVRSADFERPDGHTTGWWGWKPDKRALEALYSTGELMIARRDNFQRVYDLRERVLPAWDDADLPDPEVVRCTLALNAVRALGVTRARWLADYFRTEKRGSDALLESLANEGALLRAGVAGWPGPGYVHPDNAELAADPPSPELTTLLSPFDPLVWDRERARAMFDFDYAIECYTPAARRRYGYFTLPILRRGALIGRLDAKAHRRDRQFEVRTLHLEPGVAVDDALVADVAGALRECAAWHKTPEVVVRRSDPPELAPLLQRAVDGQDADPPA